MEFRSLSSYRNEISEFATSPAQKRIDVKRNIVAEGKNASHSHRSIEYGRPKFKSNSSYWETKKYASSEIDAQRNR